MFDGPALQVSFYGSSQGKTGLNAWLLEGRRSGDYPGLSEQGL